MFCWSNVNGVKVSFRKFVDQSFYKQNYFSNYIEMNALIVS